MPSPNQVQNEAVLEAKNFSMLLCQYRSSGNNINETRNKQTILWEAPLSRPSACVTPTAALASKAVVDRAGYFSGLWWQVRFLLNCSNNTQANDMLVG